MNKGRLEAFSDGVIAIIITIMVLEMKSPHSTELSSLIPIIPIFISYLLSFIYVAIYWINHHNIFHRTEKINGKILWANIHLLFWLSLVPFTTSWVGENHLEPIPVALYGASLLMCSIAFLLLEVSLVKYDEAGFKPRAFLASGRRELISILTYVVAIAAAFVSVFISIACYFLVACIWVIPLKCFKETKDQNI